jgi:subtilisin family serine protease
MRGAPQSGRYIDPLACAAADSCDYIPSGLPGVITVAAVDVSHDATRVYPWSWSNYGTCVDIWAPGVNIEAASPDCYECTATFSGASQATPLVTGLIAQYLALNPTADAADVKRELSEHAVATVLEVVGHPYDTTTHLVAQVRSC